MLKIGLTGGIGSGKTTVARLFEELGIPVYYADDRAKALQNSSPLIEEISALFGSEIYSNGLLDRKKLAAIVFQNRDLLNQLNALVHPAVARDFKSWLSAQQAPYIVKEAAIIFEIGSEDTYDHVVLVIADEATRLARVMQRDGANREEVLNRMRNQMDDNEKAERANFVIKNTDMKSLETQVLDLHRHFISSISDITK